MAAVGASLLLAAAGTFLAVSWDTLGLTARVAVVASVTGAAIVGGQRLRRVLPAVGAVVFHLGALLLPIDALGLAYQLQAGVPTRWIVVGATAAVALPWLGVVGRSRILALVGLLGLPVLATGIGAAGLVPPAPLVAASAVVAALVAPLLRPSPSHGAHTPRRPDPAQDLDTPQGPDVLGVLTQVAGPVLAVASVLVPFLATAGARLVGRSTVLGQAAAAGWVQTSWPLPAAVGIVAVSVLVVAATRSRDLRLAGVAIGTAVLAIVVTVLPPDTPRAAWLLVPAVVWLVAEVLALTSARDPLWSAPTRIVAHTLEVVAAVASLHAVGRVVLADPGGQAADVAMAAHLLVLAGAWLVVLARLVVGARLEVRADDPRGPASTARASTTPGSTAPESTAPPSPAVPAPRIAAPGAVAVVVGGLAAVHLVAAAVVAGWSAWPLTVLLVATATTSLAVELAGRVDAEGAAPRRGGILRDAEARAVAPFVATALLGLGGLAAFGAEASVLLVVAVPAVVGPSLAGATRRRASGEVLRVAALLVLLTGLLATLAGSLELAAGLAAGVGVLLATSGLLGLAACVERLEPAADTLRALGMVVGLVLTVPSFAGPLTSLGGDPSSWWWAWTLGIVPAAAVPSLVIGGWLAVDAVRTRRVTPATLAVPVGLRALATGLLAVGVGLPVVGVVLVATAVVAAVWVAVGPRSTAGPGVAAAVLAAPVGWVLIGEAPVLRVVLVILGGLSLVTVGVLRHQPRVGHLGGVVVTIGVWRLLDLLEVEALDLWLLPVAVHLVVVGELARRQGAASSWVAFVPSLLLVAVPATVERATGGSGLHAVLAGAVAVVAIVAGGARRLAGPLVVGTVVLVTVVLVETFAVVAAVPTWTWLAVGGVVLLGAAALIERTGGSPVRAVRRAVEVVGERFE